MNLKFILLPVAMLIGIGGLRFGYDATTGDAPGVEPGANGYTFSDLLSGGDASLTKSKPAYTGDPDDLRAASRLGWKTYDPGISGEGDAMFVRDSVIFGHPGRKHTPQTPADYRMVLHGDTCAPRPPLTGEKIVNANIGYSLSPTDLHVFTEPEMAEDTRLWLNAHYEHGLTTDQKPIARDHDVPVVDLALTDTSAPQYLILQHRQGRVLWNIHPAPGVTIAHIVTVGADTVALNPPPGDYDVQNLRAGTDCIPAVARNPQVWWGIFDELKQAKAETWGDEKAAALKQEIDDLFAAYTAYDTWFRQAFGQPSEQGAIGTDLAAYLLAGPTPATPEDRVPYRPVQGSTVLVTEQDYIFTAPERDRAAFMTELQLDFIATAAGGSFDAIHPAPMQRSTQ